MEYFHFEMAKVLHRIGVTADFGKHRGVRRAWCISIVATLFLISQLVGLGVRDVEHLQYAVILVGISYGGVFGLLPTIIIEWFGMGTQAFVPLRIPGADLSSGFSSPL